MAEQTDRFIGELEAGLLDAEIPGGCFWDLHSGQEESAELVVGIRSFPDFRIYLQASAYGAHLHVSRVVTLQPGWVKRQCASHLYGDPYALSIPKTLARQQELSVWVGVVHRCLLTAVESIQPSRARSRGGLLQIRRTETRKLTWE